jgi:hypothetical protein
MSLRTTSSRRWLLSSRALRCREPAAAVMTPPSSPAAWAAAALQTEAARGPSPGLVCMLSTMRRVETALVRAVGRWKGGQSNRPPLRPQQLRVAGWSSRPETTSSRILHQGRPAHPHTRSEPASLASDPRSAVWHRPAGAARRSQPEAWHRRRRTQKNCSMRSHRASGAGAA